MSLTWRDVAGQVQAPDLGDATTSITRGLQLLADAAQQPEQRRQAQLAREIAATEAQSRILTQTVNSIQQQEDRKQAVAKETALKDFSRVQSVLEEGARQAGLRNIPLDQYLAGSKEYASLSDDAKAFAASHLSDARMRGDETRMTMEQRAADDARQQAQWQANYALAAQSARDSRLAASELSRMREIEEQRNRIRLENEQAEAREAKFQRSGLGRLSARVSNNYASAAGLAYSDKDWADIAKKAGVNDTSEYREALSSFNEQRIQAGKKPLPEGAAKALLASQIGKNGWLASWGGETDQSAIEKALGTVALEYDMANAEADVIGRYRNLYNSGEYTPDMDAKVQDELKRIRLRTPPKPAASVPAVKWNGGARGM